jgi:hypothetical protein
MKKLAYIFFIVIIFQSCSWQEYFTITNQTKTDIIVEYEIEQPKIGFAIFDDRPTIYKTSNSGDIDWNEIIDPNDQDTARLSFKIVLAPNNTLTIGHLSNDNYKKYNQYFINGRTFNLKKISIKKETTTIQISPENFDNYFLKKNGIIGLKIKEK